MLPPPPPSPDSPPSPGQPPREHPLPPALPPPPPLLSPVSSVPPSPAPSPPPAPPIAPIPSPTTFGAAPPHLPPFDAPSPESSPPPLPPTAPLAPEAQTPPPLPPRVPQSLSPLVPLSPIPLTQPSPRGPPYAPSSPSLPLPPGPSTPPQLPPLARPPPAPAKKSGSGIDMIGGMDTETFVHQLFTGAVGCALAVWLCYTCYDVRRRQLRAEALARSRAERDAPINNAYVFVSSDIAAARWLERGDRNAQPRQQSEARQQGARSPAEDAVMLSSRRHSVDSAGTSS